MQEMTAPDELVVSCLEGRRVPRRRRDGRVPLRELTRLNPAIRRGSAVMSAAIAALFFCAPGVAQGMTEIGAVEEPVPVRVFPIDGPHDLERTPTNGFGGGRGHNGQDMFAACGTPVVASQGGKVREAEYHPAGGNFIVITEEHTGLDAVYMH